MTDKMLTELYRRAFDTKRQAELFDQGEQADRRRQVAIAKNQLLAELIEIRTDQIRREI